MCGWTPTSRKGSSSACAQASRSPLRTDLYGRQVTYHGHLAGIAAGSGNAFALLPAQNASGNWIKIVQRVPVRILLDSAELKAHPLRIGLSANVRVDLHDTSGPLMTTAVRNVAVAAPKPAPAMTRPLMHASRPSLPTMPDRRRTSLHT